MSINQNSRKRNFNTLGNNRTLNITEPSSSNAYGLYGKGADLESDKLSGWIKKKALISKLSLSLIGVAEQKNRDPKFIKSLWNTYYCMERVYTINGKLFTWQCRNKLCSVCNGIKKATMIKQYLPIISQWEDPQFVTLTIKSIYKYKLREYLYRGMNRGLSKIIAKYNRKHRNGTGEQLMGIRSLECNFNPKKRTYNPHFHIIVPDKKTAVILVKEWMKICGKLAGPKSQKIRPVENLEKDLIEVIKYGTKIFTDPSMTKGKKKLTDYKIYVSALENILYSFGNTRRHGHFGFTIGKRQKSKESVEIQTEIKEWKFDKHQNNWVNKENEVLVNNQIDDSAVNHYNNLLDTEAE